MSFKKIFLMGSCPVLLIAAMIHFSFGKDNIDYAIGVFCVLLQLGITLYISKRIDKL